MDAYSSYIKVITDDRTGRLRREAEEYRLSTAARRRRRQRWATAWQRLVGRRVPAPALPLPRPTQAWASSSNPSSR